MKSYSLLELAQAAQVTPRTIRFYIQQGLLPSPGSAGPGVRYSEGHLARLRLIRELQRQHLPLAEIRARLTPLSDEEVRDALATAGSRPTDSAVDYIRAVLGAPGLRAAPARVEPPRGRSPLAVAATEGEPTMAQRRPLADPSRAAERPPSADTTPGSEPSFLEEAEPAAKPAAASLPGPLPEPNALRQPDRSQWERLVLHPDIELHIRRPLSRHLNRQVERLVRLGRQLLEEDQP